MSNAVFPSLPGLAWSVMKTPKFKTTVQEVTSGKEVRIALMSYPLWQFTLRFEFLRAQPTYAEFQTLVGFFNARLGSFDSWLFNDPTDNAVTGQAFGMGDASTNTFQLVRAYGGFTEPVQNLNAAPRLYANGVLIASSAYTIGATGGVTFNAAPAAGAILTWTGTYYYRCRFMHDEYEFENFMTNLWSLKKMQFQSVKL